MWFFTSPEIAYGEEALSYLADLPGKRAFIVTDAVLHSMGFRARVEEQLQKAGIASSVYAEVEPEPSLQTVRKGAALNAVQIAELLGRRHLKKA